jgi:hypothetical protein
MMPTILDFQLRPTSKESYSLGVFARGHRQPPAAAAFDYPLSFMTEFDRMPRAVTAISAMIVARLDRIWLDLESPSA